MIPYNYNIITNDDVQKEYSKSFDTSWLKKRVVQKFVKEELNELIDIEHDRAIYENRKPAQRESLLPIARAKAVYHYLWAIDHVTDQMVKWGWDIKDIVTLIKRMQKVGYDPYSVTEDTTGQFIESLPGHGFKTIQPDDGDEYLVYNPKGYGQPFDKKDATPK